MHNNRLHLAMLAVMLGSAALVGCKKKEDPAPMPPIASDTAPGMQAPGALPATASVTSVDLGNAVGADLRVATPMTTFGRNDTIYAAIATATGDPAASVPGKVSAKWTHVDSNQVVHEESRDLALAGDGVTSFQISKPDGWPTGKYRLEVMLDGNVVQTREFDVR